MFSVRCFRIPKAHDRPGRTARLARGFWIALGLLLTAGRQIAPAQQVPDPAQPGGKWETLEHCELVTNALADGDSFHVLHSGREYVFRLYFVDAPEKDPTLTERIQDQAAYFGVAPESVTRAGVLAARFTRGQLTGTNFTVLTRWQNAMGRSSLARFYAVVLIGQANLAEELVAHGLARIYGLHANFPGGPRSTTFVNQLKHLELTAREKQLGVWDERQFPRVEDGHPAASTKTTPAVATEVTPAATAKVELNSATLEELVALPGVGRKLAERIVAHRPYATVDDLAAVPGIGPKTLAKVRPLVWAERAKPDAATQP
jgi:competence ComEA-like helix-hairpin-helix protein